MFQSLADIKLIPLYFWQSKLVPLLLILGLLMPWWRKGPSPWQSCKSWWLISRFKIQIYIHIRKFYNFQHELVHWHWHWYHWWFFRVSQLWEIPMSSGFLLNTCFLTKKCLFSKKKRLILERGVLWQLPFQLLVYFLRYLRLILLHKVWGTIFCVDQWVLIEYPWNMAYQTNLSLITYFRQFSSSMLEVISQWQWLTLKHGNSV